jgi:hypothetical protein
MLARLRAFKVPVDSTVSCRGKTLLGGWTATNPHTDPMWGVFDSPPLIAKGLPAGPRPPEGPEGSSAVGRIGWASPSPVTLNPTPGCRRNVIGPLPVANSVLCEKAQAGRRVLARRRLAVAHRPALRDHLFVTSQPPGCPRARLSSTGATVVRSPRCALCHLLHDPLYQSLPIAPLLLRERPSPPEATRQSG